jgi:hypothetical protein
MTSQLDPLLTASIGTIYSQKLPRKPFKGGNVDKSRDTLIFECCSCERLVTNEKIKLFKQKGERKCFKCKILADTVEE